jgi:uncharacterized YccA/Bax inhibitor family protein
VASNPVLRGFEKNGRPGFGPSATGQGPVAPPPPSAQQLDQWYAQPAYGQQTFGPPIPAPSRYLTLDDVITRSVLLIGSLFAAAAVAWFVFPDSAAGPIALISILAALGLGLYMAFSGKANAATTVTYAVLQGFALGAISEVFNKAWPSIVIQAVTGTIMVAAGVLIVYKTGAVRVTPRFTKIVLAATIGVVGLMLVNLLASLITPGGLGLRDAQSPAIAIGFSLLCIGIAAANLIVDFDLIEQSVRRGVDERYGWYLSWGLLVTLVWLYLEILRLLSYLRGSD